MHLSDAFYYGLDGWVGRYFAKNIEAIAVRQRQAQRINQWRSCQKSVANNPDVFIRETAKYFETSWSAV
ncbi:hypothetical protein ESCAB7627_2293 [Escherichia albertii TW07627]|uniref:Uncharacterized protein n=1 Tax=Escherichia albertii (strain TW07627) TaxID=502347 RepID=A0ABC9NJ72_ESCAT|nr:hypothetical protein ESCAB7627_2293 [Escherichia albertii TW07627]GAL54188.1 hypothetical protein EA14781_049_00220 [Escherichia albertii NBRC 107761 = DSM 17582]HAH3028390.1 hypothetical protein [Escherichia albertii]HAH3042939.1 hypothetical protein [Escherichia albertii]HAH3051951.1 hypothetical protein [Escherichia albertii]